MPHKNKRISKKRKGGASNYGMYIWGANQTNDPSQGNALRISNPPLMRGGSTAISNIADPSSQMLSTINAMTEVKPNISPIINPAPPTHTGGKRAKKISVKHKRKWKKRKNSLSKTFKNGSR